MLLKTLSLFFLSSSILKDSLSSAQSVIPTREEQNVVLSQVKAIFEQAKFVVNQEADATDASIKQDVEKLILRARDHLSLVQELALIKLLFLTSENSVCTIGAKSNIQKIIDEGESTLDACLKKASENVHFNSNQVNNITGNAVTYAETLLETLANCSQKSGLQQFTCYRKIVMNDVSSLKDVLLEAIDIHKVGHLEAISIRNKANECVDEVIDKYQIKIAEILGDAFSCK